MDANFILNTAETIRQQLLCLTDINVLLSWGVSNLGAVNYHHMAALKFKVNGRLHKGDVIIAYNEGSDYYAIYFIDSKGERMIADDVDFTMLSRILDEHIEVGNDPEAYKKFCQDEFNKLIKGDID